jgi:hypothetical protein
MKTTEQKITVSGTGSQAPYGIGEIIAEFKNSPAGLKKAIRKAAYWYNAAAVKDVDGNRVDIDYDIVRDCDRGYAVS